MVREGPSLLTGRGLVIRVLSPKGTVIAPRFVKRIT